MQVVFEVEQENVADAMSAHCVPLATKPEGVQPTPAHVPPLMSGTVHLTGESMHVGVWSHTPPLHTRSPKETQA